MITNVRYFKGLKVSFFSSQINTVLLLKVKRNHATMADIYPTQIAFMKASLYA